MDSIEHQGGRVTLRTLSFPMRLLLSCFLITIGFGYLAAVYYLFSMDIDPHQKMGMSLVSGIEMKYHGARTESRLEAALRGAMASRIAPADRAKVIGWIREGAPQREFANIRPILQRECMVCHSPQSGLPVPPLTTFEQVTKFTRVDTGPTLADLARVSHIHLFGISLIFVLTGVIFSLSETATRWRALVLVLPYLAIWADIGSWWITKYAPAFAYVVIGGGALMGLSLAVQIFVPLWEMWLGREHRGASPGPRSERDVEAPK